MASIKMIAAMIGALATMDVGSGALAGPLTVTVDSIEARGGTLYVSVQTETEFMQPTATEGSMVAGPEAGTATFTYDLPAGDYAVTVWHDDNGNGAFDRGDDGWPLDGWAMSTGPMTGPPSFSDAAVTVDDDGESVLMSMTYGR